jgi:hypothetical protein
MLLLKKTSLKKTLSCGSEVSDAIHSKFEGKIAVPNAALRSPYF